MMGMCFKGKATKTQIVKMYDQYVKDNPVDVLRCLRPEELTQINNSRLCDAIKAIPQEIPSCGRRLWDFDYASLITLGPLDSDEALDAIDALRDASLAMMQDIQRSDAKQPKLLMQELFAL